jgi:5S rRNA maturation endonuclease (ribonuclease M5)
MIKMPKGLYDAVNSKDRMGELFAAIHSEWNSPTGSGRVIVLVEGSTDCKIYEKYFDNRSARLEFAGGKESLEKVLEMLTKETKKIIGIQDADFSHLENKEPEIEGLFFTDYHDIEMTMFKAEGVVKNIFSEYGSIYDMEDIWKNIMENASYIGYIHWYNEQTNFGYSIDGIFFKYDITNPSNEKSKIIEVLNNQSENKKQELRSEDIENFIEIHKTGDYYNLCNGHDVIKLLMKTLSQGERNLYTALRLSYQNHHFIKTKLYRDIVLWQEQSGYSVVQGSG